MWNRALLILSLALSGLACDPLEVPNPDPETVDAGVKPDVEVDPRQYTQCPSNPDNGCLYSQFTSEGNEYFVIRSLNWDFRSPNAHPMVLAWFSPPPRDFTCCYGRFPNEGCVKMTGEEYFCAGCFGDNTEPAWGPLITETTCIPLPEDQLPTEIFKGGDH